MPARPRILTIDDSRSVQFRYFELLQSIEAEIDTANDGEEGLEKAIAGNYDLIITDVRMPKMTGIELCHALQNIPKTQTVPVIMISDFDSEKDIESGFEVGATAYISKRDVQSLLVKTVSECLWKSEYRPKRLILVVDDSQSIQRFVEMGLHQTGFDVLMASNGKEALGILSKQKPDLILSDISMPVMDGFELCRRVNKNPRLASIPFVVMSSSDDRFHMNRIMQYGAASYVTKPFSLDRLINLIDGILSDQFLLLLKERERVDLECNRLILAITNTVTAMEGRDPYAAHHSLAVARTASAMLAITGVSKSDIESLRLGARIHNIGNIGVRDSILLKPWKLSAEELEHVKQHPVIGKEIIGNVPSLAGLTSIVYHHHERWDGTGYPEGLKGNDIPFWARLVAVADTYHALINNRAYRSAFPDEQALQIIRDARESQLCPECVDFFFEWNSRR